MKLNENETIKQYKARLIAEVSEGRMGASEATSCYEHELQALRAGKVVYMGKPVDYDKEDLVATSGQRESSYMVIACIVIVALWIVAEVVIALIRR